MVIYIENKQEIYNMTTNNNILSSLHAEAFWHVVAYSFAIGIAGLWILAIKYAGITTTTGSFGWLAMSYLAVGLTITCCTMKNAEKLTEDYINDMDTITCSCSWVNYSPIPFYRLGTLYAVIAFMLSLFVGYLVQHWSWYAQLMCGVGVLWFVTSIADCHLITYIKDATAIADAECKANEALYENNRLADIEYHKKKEEAKRLKKYNRYTNM